MKYQAKPSDVEAWLAALGLPNADRDYKPGHQRVLDLMSSLILQGHIFHRPKLRIRIAGTNGKGSTAHFLAAAFQANGFRVGLYTSPHLLHFHERMRLDGQNIPQQTLMQLMAIVMPLALEAGCSYFETATVLALLYFSQKRVDIEILEAGVGAKLDATTAVEADVGLLTPIALDHQAWLGKNIEDITCDKVHVFDDCAIHMSAPQTDEVSGVLKTLAADTQYTEAFQAPLLMQGEYQKYNAGLAFAAVQAVNRFFMPLDISKAKTAICGLKMPGRLESISFQGHTFCLDVAHNVHAIDAIIPFLSSLEEPFDVLFLCTREDRALGDELPKLKPFAKKTLTYSGSDVFLKEKVMQLLDIEVKRGIKGKFMVMGSFITVNAALSWMDRNRE